MFLFVIHLVWEEVDATRVQGHLAGGKPDIGIQPAYFAVDVEDGGDPYYRFQRERCVDFISMTVACCKKPPGKSSNQPIYLCKTVYASG